MGGSRLFEQMAEGAAVSLCQIHHMQIVTDSSAVRRRIVLSKNLECFTASSRHLGDVWEQVVGDAQGIFADVTTGVSTHWIEISEAGNAPGAYPGECLQHHFHGELRLRIGMHGSGRRVLAQWERLRFPIHRRGAAENERAATVPFHRIR